MLCPTHQVGKLSCRSSSGFHAWWSKSYMTEMNFTSKSKRRTVGRDVNLFSARWSRCGHEFILQVHFTPRPVLRRHRRPEERSQVGRGKAKLSIAASLSPLCGEGIRAKQSSQSRHRSVVPLTLPPSLDNMINLHSSSLMKVPRHYNLCVLFSSLAPTFFLWRMVPPAFIMKRAWKQFPLLYFDPTLEIIKAFKWHKWKLYKKWKRQKKTSNNIYDVLTINPGASGLCCVGLSWIYLFIWSV